MSQPKIFTITIKAQPSYLANHSDAGLQRFIWSYEISITNESEAIIQLLHRFWKITDLTGKVELVEGVGVVGLQPIIKPNTTFTYNSFCQLTTPQGTMEGEFEFQDLEDHVFRVPIPKFILTAPTKITKKYKSKLH